MVDDELREMTEGEQDIAAALDDAFDEEQDDCDHEYEDSICIKCDQVYEPDDFTGATDGDR